ncbi:MAG: Ig-like domain-containing protein [Gemmatimonadota bacterium]|nr:Ig-like domain-containing protein [Gemmatimonadota bacterium]
MTAPFSRSTRSMQRLPGAPVRAPILLAALLLHACSDDPTDPAMPGASRILVEPDSVVLNTIGASTTLTATVIDAKGDTIDDASVTWTSADAAVATVDKAGMVTSVDFGQTKVSATYDSVTGHAAVEVAPKFTDREVLEIFYEATGGDDWDEDTNWLSNQPLSRWAGIETGGEGQVIGLSLPWNNLTGGIPPELGYLANLEVLSIYGNLLAGRIPPELGMLTSGSSRCPPTCCQDRSRPNSAAWSASCPCTCPTTSCRERFRPNWDSSRTWRCCGSSTTV